MVLATMAGMIIGYAFKHREHEKEIDAILRIAKRKEEAMLTARKGPPVVFQANLDPCTKEKERAPKGPPIKFKNPGKPYGDPY